jgi:hypothetical protein
MAYRRWGDPDRPDPPDRPDQSKPVHKEIVDE